MPKKANWNKRERGWNGLKGGCDNSSQCTEGLSIFKGLRFETKYYTTNCMPCLPRVHKKSESLKEHTESSQTSMMTLLGK